MFSVLRSITWDIILKTVPAKFDMNMYSNTPLFFLYNHPQRLICAVRTLTTATPMLPVLAALVVSAVYASQDSLEMEYYPVVSSTWVIGNCSCKDVAYYLISYIINCTDYDECLFENGGCNHICTNLIPGHECNCVSGGFELDEDGYTCSGVLILISPGCNRST